MLAWYHTELSVGKHYSCLASPCEYCHCEHVRMLTTGFSSHICISLLEPQTWLPIIFISPPKMVIHHIPVWVWEIRDWTGIWIWLNKEKTLAQRQLTATGYSNGKDIVWKERVASILYGNDLFHIMRWCEKKSWWNITEADRLYQCALLSFLELLCLFLFEISSELKINRILSTHYLWKRTPREAARRNQNVRLFWELICFVPRFMTALGLGWWQLNSLKYTNSWLHVN